MGERRNDLDKERRRFDKELLRSEKEQRWGDLKIMLGTMIALISAGRTGTAEALCENC